MTDERASIKYVTVALIFDKTKENILLVKRARDPYRNYWSFPSGVGFSRFEDDPKKAVVKEVESDINCAFSVNGLVTEFQETLTDNALPIYVYYGKINGQPIINREYILQVRWFHFEEARRETLAFEHNKILNKFVKDILQ